MSNPQTSIRNTGIPICHIQSPILLTLVLIAALLSCRVTAATLGFSTCFGGAGYDAVNDLAVDRDGNLLVVGETRSVDLPSTPDAFQPDYGGGSAFGHGDGFIARFSPNGQKLLYCSYFGGSGDERIWSLAVAGNGAVCLAGHTDSRDFPLENALQSVYGGGDSDGFIARLDPSLTDVAFSTYLGGGHRDEDPQVALDADGLIYVGGSTLSTNFPVTPGAFQTEHLVVPEIGDNWDGFIAKLTADGSSLRYSTYVGNATDDFVLSIAADSEGGAYVTGSISASWDEGALPLGFQPEPGFGNSDGWVAKLKSDGSNFQWFSYLGGSGEDYGSDLELDPENNVYVTGHTTSANFPIRDVPQPQFAGGGQDAFVSKISPDGLTLLYSTYLGGSWQDWGFRLAVDHLGTIVVGGQTWSHDFPVLDAFQSTNATNGSFDNPADAIITRITPAIEAPTLRIVPSGTNVLITWPTNFTEFTLQSRATLSPPADWQPVTATPLVLGGQFTVVQPAAQTSQLFRLQQP